MLRPGDKNYNYNEFDQELNHTTVTLDELITSLAIARDFLGGDCIVLMAYDGGAGYDCIRSIHGESFHGELICTLSCNRYEELDKEKIKLFVDSSNRKFRDYRKHV